MPRNLSKVTQRHTWVGAQRPWGRPRPSLSPGRAKCQVACPSGTSSAGNHAAAPGRPTGPVRLSRAREGGRGGRGGGGRGGAQGQGRGRDGLPGLAGAQQRGPGGLGWWKRFAGREAGGEAGRAGGDATGRRETDRGGDRSGKTLKGSGRNGERTGGVGEVRKETQTDRRRDPRGRGRRGRMPGRSLRGETLGGA